MGYKKSDGEFCSFEESLGYSFLNKSLLEEALTHASFANESGLSSFNERLEYLGDALLELCVSAILYKEYPGYTEGELTRSRASVVCESSLAKWVSRTELPALLRISKGLERQNGRENPSILADAAEAVFGAVFLDGGYDSALSVVRIFMEKTGAVLDNGERDAKSRLQELLQASGDKPPSYRIIERSGPDHKMSFKIEVTASNGAVLANGEGRSIKAAEFDAAERALLRLMREHKGNQKRLTS